MLKRREFMKGVLGALSAIPLYGLVRREGPGEELWLKNQVYYAGLPPGHVPVLVLPRKVILKYRQMGFSSYNLVETIPIEENMRHYWLPTGPPA